MHRALVIANVLVGCFLAGGGLLPAGEKPPRLRATAHRESKLDAAEAAAVDAAVEEERRKQGIVGCAVGLLHDGEIVYLKGYGLADRKQRTPATVQTVFNWASNSKPLCAVAAMQLVEEGKLDLDADVRTYVPEYPASKTRIAVRHLLCHQSGIPHYDGRIVASPLLDRRKRPHSDPIHALDVFSQSPLEFAPGTDVGYSSYAYILLSAVVQRAGKAGFDAQIHERIAKPLGLKSLERDVTTNGQPHWATGYELEDGEAAEVREQSHAWKHGAGAYKSNIADFARWARALLHRELLEEESYRQLWRAQPLADGTATSWGLGFAVEQQNGGLKVSHNGEQNEATSRLVLYVKRRHGIVVLTNCGHAEPGKISTAIYEALEE